MITTLSTIRCLTCAVFVRLTFAWGFFGRTQSTDGNANGTALSALPTALQLELLERSAQVRHIIGERPPTYKDKLENVLSVNSSFYAKEGHLRGFCNWIWSGISGKAPITTYKNTMYAIQHFYADPSKAINELGLPQTPIETAVKDAVDWFRANGYVD